MIKNGSRRNNRNETEEEEEVEPEADVENDGLIGMSMEFVDAPENEIVTSRDVTEAPDVKMMAMMASVGADFECAYRTVCAVMLDDIDRKAGRDEPLEDEKIDDDVKVD